MSRKRKAWILRSMMNVDIFCKSFVASSGRSGVSRPAACAVIFRIVQTAGAWHTALLRWQKPLVFLVLLLGCTTLYAGVYKWTDSDGQVHYGDMPQNTEDTEEISVDAEPASGFALDDDSRHEKRQKLLDAMEEDRLEKKEQREKDRVEKEQRSRRCAWLRDKLRRTQSATGVYKLDKDGNRVFLSNDQRTSSESRLRAQIRKECG